VKRPAKAKFRQVFDPAAIFVARKAFKVSGREVAVGVVFDSKSVPLRRLRQLFDTRFLGYEGEPGALANLPLNPDRPRLGDLIKLDEARTAADAEAAQRRAEAQAALPFIPADWAVLAWPKLLQLASQFSKVPVRNKLEATAAVEAEVLRRARAA
jgi:hypothetical protein